MSTIDRIIELSIKEQNNTLTQNESMELDILKTTCCMNEIFLEQVIKNRTGVKNQNG